MKIKSSYLYASIAAIHGLLIFIAFPAFFLHPRNAMFNAFSDGIKNYFTLYSYTRQPVGTDGIFKYNAMAYPFGDYVYYTDNTPFFSIPFKWFCYHIHDISAYTIPAFNYFIIFNILLAGLLVFFIFKRLIGKNIFSFCLAIILPWINMQVFRIWEGDFNLSCSVLPLSALVLFIAWYDNRENTPKKIAASVCMVALIFFSFLVHGYYIAIISAFLSGMLLFAGIALLRQRFGKQNLIAAVLIPLISVSIVMIVLYFTDKYLLLRKEDAMGYDGDNSKVNFILLFTHYDFHSLGFPIASTKILTTESKEYLGNIGLFSFAAIWVGALFSTNFRAKIFTIQKRFFSDTLKKSIFWGGILSLLISFGEHYVTRRDELKIYTPFQWINNISTNTLLIFTGVGALIIYGIILAARPKARQQLRAIWEGYKEHPYRKTGVLLCAAIMIYLFIGRYTVPVINILNPFYYLHFFTKRVEQFRCISRFSWPFFWTFYVWIMYTVVQLYLQSGKKTKGIILALFMLVGGIEVNDYIRQARLTSSRNIFSDQELSSFNRLKIDLKEYQAILPIPFYVVGSEDYPHTIDDNNEWSIYTMQLSLYARLPLMACKMSRTPPEFSVALLDMVCNDSLQPVLKSRLNQKPVLVTVCKRLIDDPNEINMASHGRTSTMEYYKKATEFVTRHHLTPIDSIGGTIYYRWTPMQ